MSRSLYVLAALLAFAGCSCEPGLPSPNQPSPEKEVQTDRRPDVTTTAHFVEKTSQAGVHFTYRNGQEAGHRSILESLGGGVALFDFDADGDLDLFCPGGGEFGENQTVRGRTPAFFRNEGSWQFTEITKQAGVTSAPYYSHGGAVGDYDNDGFRDLLVTGYGGLLLCRNQGDGTFEAVTTTANLHDRLWSSSAAWGDVDGDGYLDLYVVHYVNWSFENHPFCPASKPGQREVCPPRLFDALADTFYLSNGDGTFRDVSQEIGLREDGKGLGVLMADVDLDGDLDVYVGNDTVPNFLYRNDGEGRLEEVALTSGTAQSDLGMSDGSMGVDLGDFNLDGLPDLWVANYEHESFALYRNEGNGVFQHVSRATGVSAVGGLYVGWGTAFFDFDRDGDEDIFTSNGHVIRFPVTAPLRQEPLLFENQAGKGFLNVASAAGPYLAAPHMGRGVALGDVDDDGDQDLAVSHTNEPLALLSNESANQNHWLSLRLIGRRSNRDAVGTVVRIRTAGGEQMRQVKGGASYASSSDLRVFFGLGEQRQVDRIEIRWPAGETQLLSGVPADRTSIVHEPR